MDRMSISEAARLTGFTGQTIMKWGKEGKITLLKSPPEGRWRTRHWILPDELKKFLLEVCKPVKFRNLKVQFDAIGDQVMLIEESLEKIADQAEHIHHYLQKLVEIERIKLVKPAQAPKKNYAEEARAQTKAKVEVQEKQVEAPKAQAQPKPQDENKLPELEDFDDEGNDTGKPVQDVVPEAKPNNPVLSDIHKATQEMIQLIGGGQVREKVWKILEPFGVKDFGGLNPTSYQQVLDALNAELTKVKAEKEQAVQG